MKLVEKNNISINNPNYKELDNLCFLSKNLYNKANYYIRQAFIASNELFEDKIIKNRIYLNYYEIYNIIKNEDVYKVLPAKVSQQILMLLDKNWKSFFKSIKDYKINPLKYEGRPKLPKYKNKTNGRNILIYSIQAINKKDYNKTKSIGLSGTNIKIKSKIDINNINQIRIIPKINSYIIEIVYEKDINDLKLNKDNIIGVDLGINNLCAITSNQNNVRPLLINGRPLKAINQYYNKKLAKLNSKLDQDFYNEVKKKITDPEVLKKKRRSGTSNSIKILTNKRNNKINDYLHNTSRFIINHLINNNIGTLVIGKNKLWKQESNIGKCNNQNFIQIPHAKLIDMIVYKAELVGINVILTEESYTSKCSFIDNETIKYHDNYLGKRKHRGLFISNNGISINADVNGSGNIIRKVFPNAFANGIEGVVVHPILINPIKA